MDWRNIVRYSDRESVFMTDYRVRLVDGQVKIMDEVLLKDYKLIFESQIVSIRRERQ